MFTKDVAHEFKELVDVVSSFTDLKEEAMALEEEIKIWNQSERRPKSDASRCEHFRCQIRNGECPLGYKAPSARLTISLRVVGTMADLACPRDSTSGDLVYLVPAWTSGLALSLVYQITKSGPIESCIPSGWGEGAQAGWIECNTGVYTALSGQVSSVAFPLQH